MADKHNGGSTDGATTDDLLKELRASGTDMTRLIERVAHRKPERVWVSSQTIAAWKRRAPDAWAKVRKWLARRKVTIVVVGELHTPTRETPPADP